MLIGEILRNRYKIINPGRRFGFTESSSVCCQTPEAKRFFSSSFANMYMLKDFDIGLASFLIYKRCFSMTILVLGEIVTED